MPRFSGMRLAIQFPPPPDRTPPVFLTVNGGSIAEGLTLSFTVTTDEKTTKALTGGADAAQFEFVGGGTAALSHVLRWFGNGTKDFDFPSDADLDSIYDAVITATDETGNTAQQSFSMTVGDTGDTSDEELLLLLT